MLTKKDSELLEEAYLSINKKMQVFPSDRETVTLDANDEVSAGAMEGPAPGVDIEMVEPRQVPSTNSAVKISTISLPIEDGEDECCEEIDMAIDNLSSIRESIMKIACHCGSGSQLEAWAQQKLAIAMDNLAGIARSLR